MAAPGLRLGDEVRVAAAAAMQSARERLFAQLTADIQASTTESDKATVIAALETALELGFHGSHLILDAVSRFEDGSQSHSLETKSSVNDFATETDKAVEALIFAGLAGKFPAHTLIGEETTSASASGKTGALTDNYTWIVDPIDGTSNFVHSYPDLCVSIGLVRNKEPLLGVVVAPLHSQFFVAIAGFGAFRNGRRLYTPPARRIQTIKGALVAGGFGYERDLAAYQMREATYRALIVGETTVHAFRMLGSAVLSLVRVGEGQLDGFICHGLHCWDMAAAAVIVTEAGAVMASADGTPYDLMARHCIAGASEALVAAMTAVTTHIPQPRDDL